MLIYQNTEEIGDNMEKQTKFVIQKSCGSVWEDVATRYSHGDACTYAHVLATQPGNENIPFRVLETIVCEVYRVRNNV